MVGWRHKKTGNLYRIVDFVIIEKNLIPAVCYEPWDEPHARFIRPCKDFFDGRFEMFEPNVDFPETLKPVTPSEE